MGKPKAPAPPPYEKMLELSERLSMRNLDLTERFLARAMQDADRMDARVAEFWELQKPEIAQQFRLSEEQRARYRKYGIPAEDELGRELAAFASPQRIAREQAAARQEVALSAEEQRRQSAARLIALGLDPSQLVSTGLDRRLAVMTGAAEAQAGTQAARAYEGERLKALADRANLFRGLNEVGAKASEAGRQAFSAGQAAFNDAVATRGNAAATGSNMLGQSVNMVNSSFNVANGIYGNQIEAWRTQMANSPAAILGNVLGLATGVGVFNGLPGRLFR